MDADPAAVAPKPRRRWLRFSLPPLLVAMTLLCMLAAWVSVQLNSARRQREAVATIKRLGGHVFFYHEMVPLLQHPDSKVPAQFSAHLNAVLSGAHGPAPAPTPVPPVPGPAWLRQWLGDDYFQTVYQVSWGGEMSEADFTQLAGLPEIRYLYLTKVVFPSKGSAIPRPLKDSDLVVLKDLCRLQRLSLDSKGISGIGLAQLESKELEYLTIEPGVNDAGMECIGKLTTLKTLCLMKCSSITDAGIAHLRNLNNLESLNLSDAQITDLGLQHLKGLTKLKHLTLLRTAATSDGIRELQQSLPTGPASISTR